MFQVFGLRSRIKMIVADLKNRIDKSFHPYYDTLRVK